MPSFDYVCKECKIRQEVFVKKYNDAVSCPKCGVDMTKLLGRFKFQFGVGEFFDPYIDTDIHPEGQPLKIGSREEFFTQCRKYGRGWRKISDRMR